MAFNRCACCLAVVLLWTVLPACSQTETPQATEPKATFGGVYKVGGGVTAPRAIYTPDPEYSERARAAGYQGMCVLWMIVTPEGRPRDIKVARSIGMGLDEKAIEAVSTWRFEPSRLNGNPVAVQINIETTFRLYNRDKKIQELWDKAMTGDPEARFKLSQAYSSGQGVPKDEEARFRLLEMSAKQRFPQAQYEMGEYLQHHGSSASDNAAAYMWYSLAQRSGWKHSDGKLKESASKMSAEDLSEAQTRVENFKGDAVATTPIKPDVGHR